MFTSESLSLFRAIVSKFHIFVHNDSYHISNALLVTAVHDVKMKLGDNILKYWEAFTWKDETSDNKLSNCSLYFTALQYTSIILKLRGHRKGRLISILNFFRKIYRTVEKLFANLLKYTEMFTEPLTRVPRYILIITFFPAIGWSYLHDLSHVFKKIETACQKSFVFYR